MKRKQDCDICKTYTFTDAHHIISKSKGGNNKKSNITEICPNCHRSVHLGEIVIEGKFMTSSGIALRWHNKDDVGIIEEKPEVYLFSKK